MKSFRSYLVFNELRFPLRYQPRLLCIPFHWVVHHNVLINLNRLPFLLAAAPDLCWRLYALKAWQGLPDVLFVIEPVVLLGWVRRPSDQPDADFLERGALEMLGIYLLLCKLHYYLLFYDDLTFRLL